MHVHHGKDKLKTPKELRKKDVSLDLTSFDVFDVHLPWARSLSLHTRRCVWTLPSRMTSRAMKKINGCFKMGIYDVSGAIGRF